MSELLVDKVILMNRKYKMFQEYDHVLLGVSCGIDSVTLMHILGDPRFKLRRTVAYVHHGLRAEADQEAEWITQLADSQGIDCYILRIDVRGRAKESGESIQMAARAERYRVLQELAQKVGAVRIALGHHANDQAETFLIRMLTGTGLEGLGGMAPVHNRIYIRPLLSATRLEIRDYAEKHRLSWLEDRSNKDPHYLRNRIRLELLPLLESIQPQLVTHLSGLSALAGEWRDWLNDELESSLAILDFTMEKMNVAWSLPIWRTLPVPLQRAVIKHAFYKLFPDERLELAHLERILRLAAEGVPNRIQLPGAGYFLVHGQRMEIRREVIPEETTPFCIPLTIPGETVYPGGKLVARWIRQEELPEDLRHIPREEAYFNVESMTTRFFIRTRRQGDHVQLFGRSKPERLKKLMIDWKIPRGSRNLLPLLVDENGLIMWVVGHRRGEAGRVTTESKYILHLKAILNENV